MNVKSLFLSGAIALSLGLIAIGCNENPIDDTPGTGTGNLSGADSLQVSSMSATSVGLKWRNRDTGAVTYMVSWKTTSGTMDSSSTTASTNATTVSNLQAGREYTFSVVSMRGTSRATAATINWAGATRAAGSTSLRMYEFASTSPSGLSLSASGGPTNVSLKAANPGLAQLAMFIYPRTSNSVDSLIIGPAYAFTEYGASANFNPAKIDSSTYISGSAYAVASLDAWYMNMSLDKMIQAGSNVNAYKFVPSVLGNSQGFVVRFGAAGSYRYARIVLQKGTNGSIVQGSYPDRYVQMEISLQTTPGLPYAKGSIGQVPPVSVRAQRMR